MTLRTVASITTGGSSISFTKVPDGGGYVPTYQSKSCPPRNLDSLAVREFKKDVAARLDPEVHAFQALADTDSSGFVSSSEARAFRQLVEFGYLAAFLQSQGIQSVAGLAEEAQVDPKDLTKRMQKYNSVAASLNACRKTPLEVRLPLLKVDS